MAGIPWTEKMTAPAEENKRKQLLWEACQIADEAWHLALQAMARVHKPATQDVAGGPVFLGGHVCLQHGRWQATRHCRTSPFRW